MFDQTPTPSERPDKTHQPAARSARASFAPILDEERKALLSDHTKSKV